MTARTFYIEAKKKKPTHRCQTHPYVCRALCCWIRNLVCPARELVTFKTIDLEDATPDASQELWHQLTCTLNED